MIAIKIPSLSPDVYPVGIADSSGVIATGKFNVTPVLIQSDVYVDNSEAFGLFEGIATTVAAAGCRAVTLNLQGTKVVNMPLLGARGVGFWTSIDSIAFGSGTTIAPNAADAIGGTFAATRLIAPKNRASFQVTLCEPGTATFEIGLSEDAILLTLADTLMSLAPVMGAVTPVQIFGFADALNGIPLYALAARHIEGAMSDAAGGDIDSALREVGRAGVALATLATDPTQQSQLRQAFVNLGLDISAKALARALLKAPVRVFETLSDAIVLAVQTDFGSAGTIRVTLVRD